MTNAKQKIDETTGDVAAQGASDIDGCIRLWGAVIDHAAREVGKKKICMRKVDRNEYSDKRLYIKALKDARTKFKRDIQKQASDIEWFYGRSFQRICGMIGADPGYIVCKLRKNGFLV